MVFRGAWQPQYVQYNLGDAVEFQGGFYEIIQPHHSQADWPPSATPALWQRVDPSRYQGQQHEDHPPVYHSPQQPLSGPNYNGFQPKPEGGFIAPNGQDVPHEEAQKPWYDIRGDTKKQLLAAGGLALGLGLVGGAMYMQHEKHEKQEKEDREAQAWELQNWVLKARKDSDEFLRDGPKGPVTWILSDCFQEHPNLLRNLVHGGGEDGQPWFIARAPYDGTMQVGKCRLEQGNVFACIGYAGETIMVKKFEALIAAPNATTWFRAHGKFDPADVSGRPVRGGHDADQSDLFVARVLYNGDVHPGKCSQVLKGAHFCVGDKERREDEYEVLCLRP